jgi:hypothetical protein
VKKGPNFAGKYTIAQWGCGTSCIGIAVINEETGTVYDGPFRFLQYDGSMKYSDGTYSLSDDFEPIGYRQDSRLLIVRGCPDSESYTGCAVFYYEWQERRFRLIEKLPASRVAVRP